MQSIGSVQAASRRPHDDDVLAALRRFGPLTRAQLVEQVGLSRTTISQVVGELLRSGVLHATRNSAPDGPGRPVERLYLDPASGHVLGIDLGRRLARIVVANAAHETVLSAPVHYPAGSTSWHGRLTNTLAAIHRLAATEGVSLVALRGVGLGVPGPIATVWRQQAEPDGYAPTVLLHELAQFAQASIQQTFGATVTIDNNIRFAGLAEAIWGAGRGSAEQLFVRVSEGMGGSLITRGEIVVGSAGLGGEIGHITVDPYGPRCHCGKRGCLEALAAVPALLKRCELTDVAELFSAWRRGEPAIRDAVGAAAVHVGRSVAAVVMATNPSVVVIGGDLVEGIPEFALLVEASVREHIIPGMRGFVAVHAAHLGPGGGALGAIAAVLQRPAMPMN
ncbi:ROK family transcriptional regulator [Georgenia subflava]|nr:ROK family transcriptional regulator [Georgenia subflava]